jgi:hypothetical protein
MDADLFHTLLRSLSTQPSRRGVARALAGLVGSGVLASVLGSTEAEAKKKKKKKKKKSTQSTPPAILPSPPPPPPPCAVAGCPPGLVCGDNFCEPPPVCCGELGADCIEACDCCGADTTCGSGGKCECPHTCNAGCVVGGECCPETEDTNCGPDQVCDDGFCVCTSGGAVCDGACCDPYPAEVCLSPTCQAGPCPADNDFCAIPETYLCGDLCACLSSIDGANVCSDFSDQECVACAHDTDCGPNRICVSDGPLCDFCSEEFSAFCVSSVCASDAALRVQGGRSGAWLRKTRGG